MKTANRITFIVFCCSFFQLFTGCTKTTNFGNDRAISGTVKDQSGNIVAGDITSTNLTVKALGAGDIVTTDMIVKGDGTFQNNKLYAKKYSIWIVGPVNQVSDTLRVDFSVETAINKDFTVTPFLTITKPAVVSNPTATSVDINYQIIPTSGQTVLKREVYCSTNPYPNASTGSGAFYSTVKQTLTTNSGTVSVTGLTTKTKYYLRIGSQATGATGFNYSEQIELTTL